MGAEFFSEKAKGRTAKSAFNKAVKEAQYDHGHGGYSGTIAEKSEFVMVEVPKGRDPEDYAESDEALDKVSDKWGPAGCIELGKGEWLFFGWASS
jgi:hypothetical protein